MPLSWIYSKFIASRNRRFDDGSEGNIPLGARTISIGNITTGGTGKTPLVIKAASLLAGRGKRVCVLTRGYGRKNEKEQILVSDSRKVLVNSDIGGDEPVEMARSLIGKAVVIADADRVSAAQWAKDKFGINTFVLDDGFQHRKAARDVDIVCIDALDPFGGEKLLPSGRLREPLENLRRASAIMITRSEGLDAVRIAELSARIESYAHGAPIFISEMRMSKMTPLSDLIHDITGDNDRASTFDATALSNSKGFAFCALGNPEAFFGMLKRDHFELAGEKAFRDHHRFSSRDIISLEREAKSTGAKFLMTTAKDAVKLTNIALTLPCFVIEIELKINDEMRFAQML